MEIVHTMANEVQAVRRTRREYSAELKTQVVQACRQPGASVAGVAMAHGINANIVHRWLREAGAIQAPQAIRRSASRIALPTTVCARLSLLPSLKRH